MQREGYYDYMLRRSREEDEMEDNLRKGYEAGISMTREPVFEKEGKPIDGYNRKTITESQLFEDSMKELNASYYACINRIKELVEENHRLKTEIEELKNNANV